MKALADKEGYETFVIPDDIGGRFSVITPVGLLPIAVAGIDIDALMKGLHDGMGEYGDAALEKTLLTDMQWLVVFFKTKDMMLNC